MSLDFINQRTNFGDNEVTVNSKNNKNELMTVDPEDYIKPSLPSTQTQLLSVLPRTQQLLLLLVVVSIILAGLVIGSGVWIVHLKKKNDSILNKNMENNDKIQQLNNFLDKRNETIKHLSDLRSKNTEQIQELDLLLRQQIETIEKSKKRVHLLEEEQSKKIIICFKSFCPSIIHNRIISNRFCTSRHLAACILFSKKSSVCSLKCFFTLEDEA